MEDSTTVFFRITFEVLKVHFQATKTNFAHEGIPLHGPPVQHLNFPITKGPLTSK